MAVSLGGAGSEGFEFLFLLETHTQSGRHRHMPTEFKTDVNIGCDHCTMEHASAASSADPLMHMADSLPSGASIAPAAPAAMSVAPPLGSAAPATLYARSISLVTFV
jgi:hypothetical protein